MSDQIGMEDMGLHPGELDDDRRTSNAAVDPSLAAPVPTPTSPAVLEPAVTPLVKVPLFMPKFLLVGETATSSKLEVPAFMVPHKAPSVDTSEDLLPKNMFDPTSKAFNLMLPPEDLEFDGMPPLEPHYWPEGLRRTVNAVLEACNLPLNAGQLVPNTMNVRQLVRGPFLWGTIFTSLDEKRHLECEDWVKWWSAKLKALDQTCEDTKPKTHGHFVIPLESLTCTHKDGSFCDLSSETLVHCAHIACIICLNSLLLWLSIDLQNKDPKSVISTCSDLKDEVSRLSDKWKCGGDYCRAMFNQWIDYIGNADSEKEEAMKLMFQWTLVPVIQVLARVRAEMLGANDEHAEDTRVSKWGDELCDFLEEYRVLFNASDDTEFLFDLSFYMVYRRTALLHRRLGHEKQTTQLLQKMEKMLDDIPEDLMVANISSKHIEYHKVDGHKLFQLKKEVHTLLINADKYTYISLQQLYMKDEFTLDFPWGQGSMPGNLDPSDSVCVSSIITKLEHIERLSETKEMFEQLDLKEEVLNRHLRFFLTHGLNALDICYSCSGWDIISCSCHHSLLPWESIREKQNFFLDLCEALGDRRVTAKVLQLCGSMMADHSYNMLANSPDAPTLKIQLEEEFNLQCALSVPECVHSPGECTIVHIRPPETNCLVACLSNPCTSGEHRRDDLRDTLKAFRLIKHSIDIYSDLFHNWTSNEDGWLKLLETHKGVHELMLTVHQRLLILWQKRIRESDDPSVMSKIHPQDLPVHPKDLDWKDLIHTQSSEYSILVLEHAFHDLFESVLVWAERGRAQTLMSQLGPWYNMRQEDGLNPVSLKKELLEFNNNQQKAWNSITSSRYACKGDHILVEYVIHTKPELVHDLNGIVFVLHESAHGRDDVQSCFFNCNPDEVEKLLEDFYTTVPLQHHDVTGVVLKLHSILERLYDLLIKPFWDKSLNPKATIIFVPDKMLYRVPFSLLRDKETQKYLFQLHPTTVAPSLRVLQHCKQRLSDLENCPLKPEGCILAVGNPAYEKDPLRGTGEEVKHLQSCFLGRVKTLEQNEATRAKFLELVKEPCQSKEGHTFAFIHLGVHGHWRENKAGVVVYGDEEIESQYKTGSLQFAKPQQHGSNTDISSSTKLTETGQSSISVPEKALNFEAESSSKGSGHGTSVFGEVGAVTRAKDYISCAADDMLPSEDIISGGFQWRTPLVVLSACNTSRGQGYNDGEVNLPRALMIAGVPASVVSQWKVKDSASPKLMKAFYENLQHGEDVATALQSAMVHLSDPKCENANNIFEWGPFLVWGLPTIQLPTELLTEMARRALPCKQRVESLRGAFKYIISNNMRIWLLKELKAVNTFLGAVSKASCMLDDNVIIEAIVATENLLKTAGHLQVSKDVIALAEEFYVLLPFEQFRRIEVALENRYSGCGSSSRKILIWRHIMHVQAMKGNHQMALDYANKILKAMSPNSEYMSLCSAEIAIILRLMGKYEEALQEFDGYLEMFEPTYGDLIQICYLKYLMNDKRGAFQYALRAKRLEGELDKPGYGAFCLGIQALPDEFRQRLLIVDESAWPELSSFDWGPHRELWTENARKSLDAKRQSESLKRIFNRMAGKNMTVDLLFKSINTFLELAFCNACAVEEEVVIKAIFAIEELPTLTNHPLVSKEVTALIEEFYKVLSIEQLNMVELELEKRQDTDFIHRGVVDFESFMFEFRRHVMYTQAMEGCHPVALDYANKMIEVNQKAFKPLMQGSSELTDLYLRQEKAVIFRLMGKWKEALEEFGHLLDVQEDYDCLIQVSYLKRLMQDESGALDYARRARKVLQGEEQLHSPSHRPFCLGFKYPDEHQEWILNVDD